MNNKKMDSITPEAFLNKNKIEEYPGGHLSFSVSLDKALEAVNMARKDAISKLWHHVPERPEIGKQIVLMSKSGNFYSWFSTPDIDVMFRLHNVLIWCYAEELVKGV